MCRTQNSTVGGTKMLKTPHLPQITCFPRELEHYHILKKKQKQKKTMFLIIFSNVSRPLHVWFFGRSPCYSSVPKCREQAYKVGHIAQSPDSVNGEYALFAQRVIRQALWCVWCLKLPSILSNWSGLYVWCRVWGPQIRLRYDKYTRNVQDTK